jgi:hypothetical protein
MKKLAEKLKQSQNANREELCDMYRCFIGYDPAEDYPEIETDAIRDTLMGWMQDRLAEDALGVAVRSIQDAFGVESGDQADHFFSGNSGFSVLSALSEYIDSERRLKAEEMEGADQ